MSLNNILNVTSALTAAATSLYENARNCTEDGGCVNAVAVPVILGLATACCYLAYRNHQDHQLEKGVEETQRRFKVAFDPAQYKAKLLRQGLLRQGL